VITQDRKRRIWVGVLAIGFFCLPLAAQDSGSLKVDYTRVTREIQGFEAALNEVILKTIANPFGISQKPKGVYLQGYGFTFQFLINTGRGLIHSPFGTFPDSSAISTDQKKQRIEGLKENLKTLLINQGGRLTQLQKGESISIVAYFEEINMDEGIMRKTLIMSIGKSDLDGLATKQVGFSELKQKVKIVEY
jgi:hypothetical protein